MRALEEANWKADKAASKNADYDRKYERYIRENLRRGLPGRLTSSQKVELDAISSKANSYAREGRKQARKAEKLSGGERAKLTESRKKTSIFEKVFKKTVSQAKPQRVKM